jgi:hypothetical protein
MNLFRSALVVIAFALSGTLSQGQQPGSLSESEIRELIRRSADNDVENTKRQQDYTYSQRIEKRRLDGKGRVKSTESETFEVMVIAREQVRRLVAKNDKPLSAKEARKEEERIDKLVDKYTRESDSDRRKRLSKTDKQIEEERQFVREIADAFHFRLDGVETVNGRPAWLIAAEPIPDYKPRSKDGKLLSKVRFRTWIDRADAQWVKLDIECIDTISFGLFVARLHKGSTMHVEQTRVNDEVWLPKTFSMKMDARFVLVKNVDMEVDVSFRDYRKFVAETTIRPIGETP